MTADELRNRVVGNLAQNGEPHVEVAADPYSGWRVVAVTDAFAGLALPERRELALAGVPEDEIVWCDLLTSAEAAEVGEVSAEAEIEDLPLWPEALARRCDTNPLFPSDLDDDIDRPITACFYSLRGGVGRSTAVAYTGRILASRGRKVVCVDMDLEAPGLAPLFGCERQVGPHQGVASLLVQLDTGARPEVTQHLIRVSETDDLYCLPAGRPDANHARLLQYIDPGIWYREAPNPLRELLELLKTRLPFTPDVILLDARTGISPMSGPLLFDLSDIAVVVFFPHPQASTGTGMLVRALLAARTQRQAEGRALSPEPRFLISPVPASKATEVVQKYRHRALEWVADWLSEANCFRDGQAVREDDVTQFVPYREVIATSDQVLGDRDVWRDFEPVAEWLERFLPTAEEAMAEPLAAAQKAQILGSLHFSAGTAEVQDDLLETFLQTDNVARALGSEVPLVLGRKGTGKTSIFRMLTESPDTAAVVVQAPGALRTRRNWMLGADGFGEVDGALRRTRREWRHFWQFYCCLALTAAGETHAPPPPELGWQLNPPELSETRVLEEFERLALVPRSALLLAEWLAQLDLGLPDGRALLFDGLDTGFGSSAAERARRAEAVSGLFAFWMEVEARLARLRFKFLLREDIWRALRFENRSHLYGRSVTLQWAEQAEFLKVAIKHALRCGPFRAAAEARVRSSRSLEEWPEEDVMAVWDMLVGERMKGGKTTFTRNWVWNRLGDGNMDHSPRYLLQLFGAVTEWERREQTRSPYERSVIRPRAFEERLPRVSEEALGALQEEFGELQPLLATLRSLAATPVAAAELAGHPELVGLAREIGLLAVHEGTEEDVARYRVPEIYRYALKLSRKGPR